MNGLNPRDEYSSQVCCDHDSKQTPPNHSRSIAFKSVNEHTAPSQTIELKKLLLSLTNKKQKSKLKAHVGGNIDFLPKGLRELKHYQVSSNPLRHQEPFIEGIYDCKSFPEDSPERLLLSVGVVLENIDMLSDMLFVISYSNDYGKKLIGKYIILELNTIYYLLQKLCEYDDHYQSQLFPALKAGIKELETKHNIVFLKRNLVGRYDPNLQIIQSCETWNKISRVHIGVYLDLFEDHLNALLPRYNHKVKFYFKDGYQFKHHSAAPSSAGYEPFDHVGPKAKKKKRYAWQPMSSLVEDSLVAKD